MGETNAFLNWFAGFVDGEGCFLMQPNARQYMARLQLVLWEGESDGR